MKRTLLIPLVLTLALGLAAGAIVMRQSTKTSTIEKKEKTVKVVVLGKDMTRGVKLAKADLALRDWPERLVTPQFVTSIGEAVGRVIVTNVVKDEPLLRSKLAPVESAEGLSTLIPAGYRALAIRVNDVTGVAGFLLPGSRVDVHATLEIDNSKKGNRAKKTMLTRTILQDVEVLAAGSVQEVGQKKSGSTVPVVTLLLTPEQSDRVALAATQGSLWLSMRNPRDKGQPARGSITVSDLVSAPQKSKPRPVKVVRKAPARHTHVVEIIQGSKRTEKEF